VIIVCPFVLFLLAILLSVFLRFTDSDYPFVIFKLFLETGQKASLCQAFLACSAASANTFNMYRHMCILQCQKVEIEPPKFF
jgi:hypothetical protein